jgi:hypothetical protein
MVGHRLDIPLPKWRKQKEERNSRPKQVQKLARQILYFKAKELSSLVGCPVL